MIRPSTTIYAASFLAGLGVVAYPASATVLRSLHPLSELQWGGLFVAHMFGVVGGSAWGARRESFRGGLGAIAASGMLALSLGAGPSTWAVTLLWLGAGTMGLGFGLLGRPLNTYPARLHPQHPERSLIAVHTFQGVGFASGPIAVAVLGDGWPTLPVFLVVAPLSVAYLSRLPRIDSPPRKRFVRRPLLGFMAVVVLYAMVEGTFANWAPVYLHEDRGVSPPIAALSITLFWAGVLLGRAVLSLAIDRLGVRRTWLGLPLAMSVVLLLLPYASGPVSGLALFAAAGLSCSAFFPLTLAAATRHFAGHESAVASVLVATLAVGIGSGSFVLGALREVAPFQLLYRLSALYPILVVAIIVAVWPRRAAAT